MSSPVAEVYRSLGNALHKLSLRWFVFGAQAAILYGSTRLTADVDATVLLGPDRIDELLQVVGRSGFVIRDPEVRRIAEEHRIVPLLHSTTGIPLDLVLGGAGLEEEFVARSVERTVEGVQVPLISVEDLIAVKILAGRHKDMDDVEAMLAANLNRMDLSLVRSTLGRLEGALDRRDLLPEFERLLARSPA